ncbi:RNA polymerase sigma factor [Faecalibacter rhinopitheci]|uniref:Sigma-70 family RNA polymerase sigma factor n=1 Tax=Faecalibacter rhinopitheci TaxID=2779678 RepID=A0A8J7FUY9_9FLAO|nr:sigma-70 family RNA polymerase sigma factor [Faecalibacter rhinopitheci]MBF0598287.1 sigma-70 family RNA polymerase sigma factor [Faecalibacter rhinopitheci]
MLEKDFELLKKGNSTAFERIYIRYNKQIFWFGIQIIKDEFVVECLLQDVFLKLWDYREKMESPEHIFFFLRLVMKYSCYSHYTKPENKFFRTVNSFESYENYQTYLAGYNPADVIENLSDQQTQQQYFDEIIKVLPLLNTERKHLIELCLKHGFQYKAIAHAMGKGITETSNEIKRAIEDLKKILNNQDKLVIKNKTVTTVNKQDQISETQSLILKLRCEHKQSFANIAQELKLSQKEVHNEFIVAYKYSQQNKVQSLNY